MKKKKRERFNLGHNFSWFKEKLELIYACTVASLSLMAFKRTLCYHSTSWLYYYD